MYDLSFYKAKTVLVTGHTGFKGSWLCKILINSGAYVIGYSLKPNTNPNLFDLSKNENKMISIIGDIRNFEKLLSVFRIYKPEIVIHLAAQPIVRESYKEPKYTYETNVMGTVNILECIRINSCVKSFLNVTTDKVYLNNELSSHGFKENEPLDGFDPYSNSKSCSELVTHSYKKSFFDDGRCAISTARAGNVIGGGDFAADRIIPDCIRAVENNKTIVVRNQNSTRPYQHVLEPLYCYLMILESQYKNNKYADYYNVGPDDSDCVTTGELVNLFCSKFGTDAKWKSLNDDGPHEANFLKLDTNKLKETYNWNPIWHISQAMDKIIEWTKVYFECKEDVPGIMDQQIKEFFVGDDL